MRGLAGILGEKSGEAFWSLLRTLEEKLGRVSRGPRVWTLRPSSTDAGGLVQPLALSEWGSLCPDRVLFLLPLPPGVERPPM